MKVEIGLTHRPPSQCFNKISTFSRFTRWELPLQLVDIFSMISSIFFLRTNKSNLTPLLLISLHELILKYASLDLGFALITLQPSLGSLLKPTPIPMDHLQPFLLNPNMLFVLLRLTLANDKCYHVINAYNSFTHSGVSGYWKKWQVLCMSIGFAHSIVNSIRQIRFLMLHHYIRGWWAIQRRWSAALVILLPQFSC